MNLEFVLENLFIDIFTARPLLNIKMLKLGLVSNLLQEEIFLAHRQRDRSSVIVPEQTQNLATGWTRTVF